MRFYKLYVLGFMLSMVQVVVGQNVKSEEKSTIIEAIPFELTDHNNIAIKAIINRADTVMLMFHTAAGSITLIEESIKTLKSISWQEEYDVESWGGKSSARYSENNVLQIENLEWDSLSIWETKNSGPKTDGKFGPNLFENKTIEIDFDNNILNIHSALPSNIDAYEKLGLLYEDGFMFLEALSMVGDKNYTNRFLIHSGYGGTILYDDGFVASSKIGEELMVISESELKDSYGNTLKTKKARLPVLRIGKTELKDIPVGFFEGGIDRQKMSVLGGDLLKRFNIIIDADRSYIYLKENHLMSTPFF